MSPAELWRAAGLRLGLAEPAAGTSLHAAVLWDIRLPRAVLALAVGATLGLAGAAMQGLFRNPLADPSLIGVSAGGAAGALLFMVFGGGLAGMAPVLTGLGLPLAAMLGGCLSTFGIYRLSLVGGRSHVATLLLTGIAVNALVSALVGLVVFNATDEQIRDFTFWTLGSLAHAGWRDLAVMLPLLLLLGAGLALFARPLNALVLGEAEAHHLGFRVQATKRKLVFLSAGAVSLTVALCGIIGFVGLVVPHLVRQCIGPDHRFLLPGAAVLGASLLLGADLIARGAVAYSELPVGVVTAALGAPFFLFLLTRTKKQLGGA